MTNDVDVLTGIEVSRLEKKNFSEVDADNFRVIWIENGVEDVTVDFETSPCFPYSIIFLTPGRVLKLRFSCKPAQGWILRFSRSFFREQHLEGLHIRNADLFSAHTDLPRIVLSPKIGQRVNALAEMIAEIMQSQIPNKELAASSMVRALFVYCDSKCNIKVTHHSSSHLLNTVSLFKQLVSTHMDNMHRVSDYAELMNISARYLNQVVKEVMGVTAKYVIQEQLLIQACRDLKFSNQTIKEIAIRLGFSEPEHFSNFFKKNTGLTPTNYRQQ